MSLVAILTDTHIGARKGVKYLQDHFENFYKNIFFPTIKERGVETILHLGDAFDSRKTIEYNSLNWARRVMFDPMKGYDVHMIVGNHDCYYKNTNDTNSPSLLLQHYDNINTYTDPTQINVHGLDILMLPWISPENEAQSLKMIRETDARIAMGHLELTGFYAYKGMEYKDGKLDNQIFDKFDKVLSGHFHTRSDDGRIHYIGNPYQMFWNDVNDNRGFILLDTETLEIEYINNPYHLFDVIYYEDQSAAMLKAKQYAGKIVKVVVRKKTDQKKFDKFVEKLLTADTLDVKVVENFNVQESDEFVVDDAEENTLSILNRYVDEAEFDDTPLEKEALKKLISEVYQEACEV